MIPPATKRVVNRYCSELLSDGEFSDADEILTSDFVIHGLQMIRGRERFLEIQATVLREAFPDLRFDVKDVFGDEHKVAIRGVTRGTHRGAYLGIEPTRRPIEVEAVMICHLSDGRIAEVWSHGDSLVWFQQLGAIPPMEWQEEQPTVSEREV